MLLLLNVAVRALPTAHADEQLARGEYTEYDSSSIHELVDQVASRGMARLAEERRRGSE